MSTWNNGLPLTVSSNYLISNLVKLVNVSVTRFSKETKEYAIEHMLTRRGYVTRVGKLFRMIAQPEIKWKCYLCIILQNKTKSLTHTFILMKIDI